MQLNNNSNEAETYFRERFNATFYGVLKWTDLDGFWRNLEKSSNNNWHIYDLNALPPQMAVSDSELIEFIQHTDLWLRQLHQEDFCGVVYVDDHDNPSFVKIYHPKKMGHGSCSISQERPLPAWVLSTIKPTELTTQPIESTSWRKALSFFSNRN